MREREAGYRGEKSAEDGLPEPFSEGPQKRRVASGFLDAFGVGKGDTVVVVSPPALNNEILYESLRRGANLVVVDPDENQLWAIRDVITHEHAGSEGYKRVEAVDFTEFNLEEKAKLVFIPAVLDDQSTTNREDIVGRACELTCDVGYVAVSVLSTRKGEGLLKNLPAMAGSSGYDLVEHRVLEYGDIIQAHAWRCVKSK